MRRGRYCTVCSEPWSRDPDKHLMKCNARELLLLGAVLDAERCYRSAPDVAPARAPKKSEKERAPRRSRAYVCACCTRPWSVYATMHAAGCSARWLIARGEREQAQRRYRVRPGGVAKPSAAPKLAERFRCMARGVER